MNELIIYLDLDGVLFDLSGGLEEVTGFVDVEDRSALFKSHLPAYVEQGGFEFHKPLPNAHHLVAYVLAQQAMGFCKVAILTSAGDFYDPQSEVIRQKKNSVELHFPELARVPFCTTSSGKDKAILAHENAILIDDHNKNVREFVTAGGGGITYHPDKIDDVIRTLERWLGYEGA